MLILQRNAGERLMIGEDIVITVIHTGDRVSLGIDAPKGIGVHREEIYERIKRQEMKREKAQ